MKRTLVIILSLIFPLMATGQTSLQALIPQDTPIHLRLAEGLSTATDHRGYLVHLEVASDVEVNGIVIVSAGTPTTAKLTHSDSNYIEFSDPTLTLNRQKVHLSKHDSAERGELSAEKGAAIGIAIFAAPVVAIQLPISAVYGLVHSIRSRHQKSAEPKGVITLEPGTDFTFYTVQRVRVEIPKS